MKIQWQRLATTGRTSPWVPLSQDPVRRICASCAPHQKLPNSCFFRSWGAYDTPGNLREPWENHGKMVMYDDLWWFNGNTIGKCASEKGPLWVDLPWFSDYIYMVIFHSYGGLPEAKSYLDIASACCRSVRRVLGMIQWMIVRAAGTWQKWAWLNDISGC